MNDKGIALLVLISIIIYSMKKVEESINLYFLGFIIAILVVLVVVYMKFKYQKRRESLMKKYNNKKLVDKIMNNTLWQGQTAEQLIDSLGKPKAIDQKILKSKKKEIWKYNYRGGNRYGLRISLDNDIVVGWDQKT